MTLSEGPEDDKSRSWKTLFQPFHMLPKGSTVEKASSSYIALFRPLQDPKSQLILCCAIALALAAGAPLPIIGVIFARIIDSFPPSEDEIRTRISQLLAVGKYIGYHSALKVCPAHTSSNCIFCDHLGMGLLLGHRGGPCVPGSPYQNG